VTVIAVVQTTLYESAARTATPTTATFSSQGRRGLHLVIDVTVVPASAPSVVPTIDGQDALSGKWYNLLTGVAITAVGTTVLKIYPGIGTIANGAASDVVPANLRLVMTHGNANSCTYTAAVHLVP
jgi:hypothetical protein